MSDLVFNIIHIQHRLEYSSCRQSKLIHPVNWYPLKAPRLRFQARFLRYTFLFCFRVVVIWGSCLQVLMLLLPLLPGGQVETSCIAATFKIRKMRLPLKSCRTRKKVAKLKKWNTDPPMKLLEPEPKKDPFRNWLNLNKWWRWYLLLCWIVF